jgi:biopolymer transport protein ExbD
VLKLQDDLIPGLKAELDLLASRPVLGADKDGSTQAVTILGDKRIPYSLLRKVMSTAARAGFAEIAFAVQRKS